MPELELALVELGQGLEFPPTPELSTRVRARIAAERPLKPRFPAFPARRTLVIALAALAVTVGALMAVPGTRAAILELLGVRGVSIERVETLPTVPTTTDLDLGTRVNLERAQEMVEFEVVVPEALGDPDEVYFSDFPPGGMVSFVYGSADEPRALFTQFRAGVDDVFFKKVSADTAVETLQVGGQPAFFLSGAPHFFAYVDVNGRFREETVRLAANVLVWERDELTLRLEGDVSRGEALAIARSVR